MRTLFYIFFAFVILGCVSKVSVREPASLHPQRDWNQVLNQHVNKEGAVDLNTLAKNKKKLERYLAYLKQTPIFDNPELPHHEARLAHALNAYNAMALSAVLHLEKPEDFDGVVKRLNLFRNTMFVIGQKEYNLNSFYQKVLRSFKDPRIHFGRHSMVKGYGAFPKAAYTVEGVDEQLDARIRKFFSSESNIQVDDEEQVVWLSELLSDHPEDFEEKHGTIISFINRYYETTIPKGYTVKYLPFNWSVQKAK